ncbi:MAG: isoprenylcysteine carboxylmethyltransferase family protein [Pyrinomonadaceae bacterium]|nr:isoprenylcysteine carboxylmethyltransferase family protein [Pyrinomonadaceae bacterium]
MLKHTLIRTFGLYLPVAVTFCLWLWHKPNRSQAAAILLACAWNVPALLLVHLLAAHYGWWRFEAQGGLFLGIPVDLYFGWMLLWGAIPLLAFRRLKLLLVIALMLGCDLLLMPACAPVVQLGDNWLAGEAVAMTVALLPSQMLARWTVDNRHLRGRAILQVILFSSLLLWVLPAVIIECAGGSWRPLFERPVWATGLSLQLLSVPVILGLSAVQEFVGRGGGTPVPYDPPIRLVTSGVYAYVANPMQLSMSVVLLVWGGLLENLWIAGACLMAVVYGIGLAAWNEGSDLKNRYGDDWVKYRRAVGNWWPRWQPHYTRSARLYMAADCDPCRGVGMWIINRRPIGLAIVAAERHPHRDLRRITYTYSDGSGEEEGIHALARALEHLHLAWAFVGWTMRLPVISNFLQIVVDAAGGGPRQMQRHSAPTCTARGRGRAIKDPSIVIRRF